MTQVAALYCVFDYDGWLETSIASIYEQVSSIYLIVSDRSWHGQEGDNVELFEHVYRLVDPQRKIKLVQGSWNNEIDQRNFSLACAIADGHEYALIIDSDEIYEGSQIASAVQLATSSPEVEVWHVKWFTYWKSVRYRIDPLEPYDPPVLLKLNNQGAFVEHRNYLAKNHQLIPPEICLCHHLSYVRSEEVFRKKHIFSQGHDGQGHAHSARLNWYKDVWLAWDNDHSLTDLHPVNPPWYKRAVEQHPELIPSVLRPFYAATLA